MSAMQEQITQLQLEVKKIKLRPGDIIHGVSNEPSWSAFNSVFNMAKFENWQDCQFKVGIQESNEKFNLVFCQDPISSSTSQGQHHFVWNDVTKEGNEFDVYVSSDDETITLKNLRYIAISINTNFYLYVV